MSDRKIAVDNGWVETFSDTRRRLYKLGYSVGGYVIDNGTPKYVLYRADGEKFVLIHEFDTEQELNNMIKLLLPPEA